MTSRVSTAIPGLDPLIEGGYPERTLTTVAGKLGTGKTTFCLQWVWEGLTRGGRCGYVALDQTPQHVLDHAEGFGWEMRPYWNTGELAFRHPSPQDMDELAAAWLSDVLNQMDVSRVAIDGLTTLLETFESQQVRRRTLQTLQTQLEAADATALITVERQEHPQEYLSRFGIAEYVSDGVLVLDYESRGEAQYRSVEVRKMWQTDHVPGPFPFHIDEEGVTVEREAAED